MMAREGRHAAGVSRPHCWLYQDPHQHELHRPYLLRKAQANFRGEEWQLSFEDFCYLWSTPELWAQRGRGGDQLVMTRLDPEKPWNLANCLLMTHSQHMKRRQGMKYKKSK